MASLAGKADPTLARMAYAAGMANVPGDYSKHYQSAVDAHKELMGGIEEIAAGFKLENDIATLEFKKAMKIFEDPLNLQMIDSDYTEMQADITAQREEWKANKGFKNDPEGRQDWDRRNQQIIGRHEQDNANLGTLQAGIEGNLYDIENMEVGKKKYLTNLAKYQANQDKQSGIHNSDATKYMKDNPNATPAQLWKKLGIVKEGVVVKFKDPVTGEYTYVSKVGEDPGTKEPLFESQKSSELLDYVNKDARADDTLVQAQALYQDRLKISKGRSDNYSSFRNEDRNALEELLDTGMLNNPNTLKYMMHKKIGGEKLSFAEALRSGKALGLTNEIIKELGATKSDGDDILTESDFATAKSYETVVNNILNGKAIYEIDGEKKSLDTKGLYLDYTVDNAFKTGYNTYKDDEKLTWAQKMQKAKYEDYIKNRDKGSELTQTLNNIVASWQSGNFEDLALPHLNKIYLNKDGEFGENTLVLETSETEFHFDVSKPSSLKKILMKYAGNNKSLQNEIESMDFDKISFGSKIIEENPELTEVVGGGKGKKGDERPITTFEGKTINYKGKTYTVIKGVITQTGGKKSYAAMRNATRTRILESFRKTFK